MEAIGHVLARVLRELGLDENLQAWRAVDDWPQVVGPRVSRHTRAVGFREGTLRVEVEGSAWMQELSFLKRDLIRRINQHLGSDLVRDVRFIVPRGGNLR
jgi:predicted nucleic acid-binding Zn ribbon protein